MPRAVPRTVPAAAPVAGPDEAPVLDPVLDFMRLLWSVEHRLERASKRMAATLGVTGPQRLVLRLVDRFPDVSAGRLAHLAQLHPSTLTGILRRLEAKRLLDRSVDPADSRRARLRVLPRARALIAARVGTVEHAVTAVLRAATPADLARTRHVLQAVAAALDDQHAR